jgi:hypothetical protein
VLTSQPTMESFPISTSGLAGSTAVVASTKLALSSPAELDRALKSLKPVPFE